MATKQVNYDSILKRVSILERELESLKRDLLQSISKEPLLNKKKPSLYGSVRGGDVTEEMIEGAKRNLFRSLNNL